MARTLEKSLLEQVQALRSKIEEVMASQMEKVDDYDDFMQSSDQSDTEELERQPDPVAPKSSKVQVVVDVHEQSKFPDADEPSVEVVQEVGKAQAVGEDEHGIEWGRAADIEPPVVVPEPGHPDTRLKQVYVTEISPEDKTTYSMDDSPIKPQVLRPRSPVRTNFFPPRPEARDYRDYYPDSPRISCSPIRQRFDPRPEVFQAQRGGMPEPKTCRTTSTFAPQRELVSRSDHRTMETMEDTVKTAVDSLVESRQPSYKLLAVQVPKYKTGQIGGYLRPSQANHEHG